MPSSAAELLRQKFPPIGFYYPHLATISAPQAAFLLLDLREAFYGGAVGGGKSDALLLAALQYVDHPGYAALLLRRTYPELEGADGLITKAHEWFGPYDNVVWNEQKKRYVFPSGAILQFGHVKEERDKYRYQGQAYQYVGFDELTHFAESQYDYIGFTRVRRVKQHVELGIPVRTRGASNPGNVGHLWVKDRFIDPRTRRPGVVFVPARIEDNPGLDRASYEQDFAHLDGDLRRQLFDGDWDAFEGAAYQVTPAHLVEGFELADSIDRFEAADYGLNGAPWCLWAVDYEGNLIAVDMLYERDLIPSDLVPLILAKRADGWGERNDALIDPSVWHRTGARNRWGQPAMLADEFTDNGVQVSPANNDPRAGMTRLRELLKLDPKHRFPDWHPRRGEPGAPRIYFVGATTERLVVELRSAPLQPLEKRNGGEIVDPEWESRHGHAAAMARYAAMSRPAPSSQPPPEEVDPRQRLWDLVEQRDQSRSRPSEYLV